MQTARLTISVNGKPRETSALRVAALATELDPAPQTLVIERNGSALPRSAWESEPVEEGDRFEILKISAGG